MHLPSVPAIAVTCFAALSFAPNVTTAQSSQRLHSDSSDVVRAVQSFHTALSTGDSAAALALLAPDAIILESGDTETRAEYRAHHLQADIAFSRAIAAKPGPLRVVVRQSTAWSTGSSTTRGTFNGRQINSVGVESMVLTKTAGKWIIRPIHWSSRKIAAPAS